MERSTWSFENLIEPIGGKQFFSDYWERDFLYVPRNQAGLFDNLFSLGDIDSWLVCTRAGEPDSIVIASPDGAEKGKQRYRPREVEAEKVHEYFLLGHSVILNGLADSWSPLLCFIQDLEKEFCARVGVNAYLTPKGSRTFPVHVDDHDVLVLQVHGEKTWRLHELKKIPIQSLSYRRYLSFSSEWGQERVHTPLVSELTMRPGDVLYIPRGMPHCAVTKDVKSFHLTVSITPLYWTDFLKIAVEQSYTHAPSLRRSLPPGFVSNPAIREEMRRHFDAVLESFRNCVSFEEALEVVMRERVFAHGQPLDGRFSQLTELGMINLESRLERRENILCYVEQKEVSFCNVRFGTRHVRGPGRLRLALEFIRDHQSFRAVDIPNLDDESKLVLVRRLVREGLLRVSEHEESGQGGSRLQAVAKSA